MLLLADGDDYFRGRRECEEVRVDENYIFSRWSPWRDVQIATWQIPFGSGTCLHRINSTRTLQTVEGGFAVMKTAHQVRANAVVICWLKTAAASLSIFRRSFSASQRNSIVTPPNSSIMFAECASIPLLAGPPARGAGSVTPSWLAEDSLLRRRHS